MARLLTSQATTSFSSRFLLKELVLISELKLTINVSWYTNQMKEKKVRKRENMEESNLNKESYKT
jgi:hypothetical protein